MPYEKNVFINCPFDNDYNQLLRPLLFSIIYLGYKPLISSTKSSSDIRMKQIKKLILNSKFSIHDLCRSKPLKLNELPRFNMPFELGLDIGCLEFKGGKYSRKKLLILEARKYHYRKVLSDISGQDIKVHCNNPKIIIDKIREWFSDLSNKIIPSTGEIWIAYNQFNYDLNHRLNREHYSKKAIEQMSTGDFMKFTNDWIKEFKK